MANILIGRSEKTHYRVSDPTVSRLHAELVYTSRDDVSIADLGSRNGTYVMRGSGWEAISDRTAIRRTDQLRFGKAKVFVADIIADARLTNPAASSTRNDQGGGTNAGSGGAGGSVVAPKRELNRPRRNIFTGEVEES